MKSKLLGLFAAATVALLIAGWGFSELYPQRKFYSRAQLGKELRQEAAGAIEYLHHLRANQVTGELNASEVYAIRMQVEQQAQQFKTSALNLEWESMGPDNVGGRARAFVIDKNNPNILYTAGVAGGIFKSTNAALSWFPVSDDLDNLAVVSMCQAANGDLYAGTGENMYAPTTGLGTATSPGMTGAGIYKSTDGGQTWTVLAATVPTPATNTASPWAAVGALGADPTNANRIYAATSGGLRRSDDGGATWTAPISFPGRSTDLTVTSNGGIWVSVGTQTYFSSNGNDGTWAEVSKSTGTDILPRSLGRQKYAVSRQDPNYVYCVQTTVANALAGVYRSENNGVTWEKIGTKSATFDPMCESQCQGEWDLTLGVSSTDKNHIFVGGITMWEWKKTAGWRRVDLMADFPGNPWFIHADKHHIVHHPTDGNIVYVVSDGGVSKSSDGGQTWLTMNRNLTTAQYYNIGFGENRYLVGGTQDNGSHIIDYKGNTSRTSRDLGPVNGFSGDGGYSTISWLNDKIFFTSYQYGRMGRSENSGESFTSFFSNRILNGVGTPGSPTFSSWNIPFELYETTNDPLSEEFVQFKVLPSIQSLGFGGGNTTFSNTLRRPQPTAVYQASSFKIVSGALTVTSDASGNLSGAGTGTFDAVTGTYTVTFNTVPLAEIVASCNVFYPQGAHVTVNSNTNALPFDYQLSSTLNPGDSVQIQDPVQSMFACGFNGSVWVTRKSLDFSQTPEWWKVAAMQGVAMSMDFSHDGNYLWVGTSNGRVIRVSNLNEARSVFTGDIDLGTNLAISYSNVVTYSGRAVTSIAVDPNNPDRVAITLGNYGNSTFVYYSNNATSANPTFSAKQGNMPTFPVYSSTFDRGTPGSLIIGTEYGIYSTDNIEAPLVSWTPENSGFPKVPVFTLKQYRTNKTSPSSSELLYEGDIFAGTHGRGMFRTTSLMTARTIGVKEESKPAFRNNKSTDLTLSPNPAKDYTMIQLELKASDVVNIFVRDISGRLVKQIKINSLEAGRQSLRVDTDDMANGTYIITAQYGDTLRSGRLTVAR